MKQLILAAALACVPLGALAEDMATLTIRGTGQIDVAPDMATIQLGVLSQAETAGQALAENSADLEAVLAVLAITGIDGRDIQTSQFSVQPVWSDYSGQSERTPGITGFTVTNEVSVRLRDLGKLGEVLDAVTQDGANLIRGLSFGLADPDPVADEARLAAMADARARADLLANAAGVEITGIRSITEGGDERPFPAAGRLEMAMQQAVPIAEGEITVSATVTVVYEIDG
ncbi:SIMPL domain-containing protein [Boseongicola sp. H5]|uniref:SIMPL domain-containing protein n=1 Tax=Boseongicola sp. H5 TaxID=2763261 RepID=UPI001D0BA144|nr:SIMPL domain-containing protein [Boseongicola sp. H5]